MMSAGSAIFCYDANGNMTQKIDGSTTNYTYDAENRMVSVSGAASATFVYDGDGNRVKGVVGGVTTTYIGNYFEWTGSTDTMKTYYYAGGTRVAEREGSTLYWLLSDHLGSTSITATSSGSKTAELRYKPWGETRYTYGTTQTTFRYTGQREESSLGLYWYASRWYSPGLGRFVSPDSIIPQPGNPQAWDRYSYGRNNPIYFIDPSGHSQVVAQVGGCDSTCMDITRLNHLISLVFKGSGEKGTWTADDWSFYYNHREQLWNDPSTWKNTDSSEGWDLFVLHVERLASNYSSSEKGKFVEDFSLLFGGISQYKSWPEAAWDARHGPVLPFLNESNSGLSSEFYDSLNPNENQSHHYAGLFFLSYHTEPESAIIVNLARDPDNAGDILLGNRAADHAYWFRYYSEGPASMATLLLGLKQVQ
jgi:RHS repeat-associated protein